MGFAWGCRVVYVGHVVGHQSEIGKGGRGCEPLFYGSSRNFVISKYAI